MNNLTRDQAKKLHQERITKLMSVTNVDNATKFDVLDEATIHLIDHFVPPPKHTTRFDHVLIIGSAYLGTSRDDENQGVQAVSFFLTGNTHELSHTLADIMREDKHFARAIFHAVEVFALESPRKSDM